ncbi:hypothetical protein ACS0PU_008542 [Formica fusca]
MDDRKEKSFRSSSSSPTASPPSSPTASPPSPSSSSGFDCVVIEQWDSSFDIDAMRRPEDAVRGPLPGQEDEGGGEGTTGDDRDHNKAPKPKASTLTPSEGTTGDEGHKEEEEEEEDRETAASKT